MLQAQTPESPQTFNLSSNIRTETPTPNSMMTRVR